MKKRMRWLAFPMLIVMLVSMVITTAMAMENDGSYDAKHPPDDQTQEMLESTGGENHETVSGDANGPALFKAKQNGKNEGDHNNDGHLDNGKGNEGRDSDHTNNGNGNGNNDHANNGNGNQNEKGDHNGDGHPDNGKGNSSQENKDPSETGDDDQENKDQSGDDDQENKDQSGDDGHGNNDTGSVGESGSDNPAEDDLRGQLFTIRIYATDGKTTQLVQTVCAYRHETIELEDTLKGFPNFALSYWSANGVDGGSLELSPTVEVVGDTTYFAVGSFSTGENEKPEEKEFFTVRYANTATSSPSPGQTLYISEQLFRADDDGTVKLLGKTDVISKGGTYELVGWTDGADGHYQLGATIQLQSNLVLYPEGRWIKPAAEENEETWTIQYWPGPSDPSDFPADKLPPTQTGKKDQDATIASCSIDGYVLDHWVNLADGQEFTAGKCFFPSEDLILSPVWSQVPTTAVEPLGKTFTVTYTAKKANGEEFTADDELPPVMTGTVGGRELPVLSFEPEGYTLNYWKCTSGATVGTFKPGATITSQGCDIVLEAVWKAAVDADFYRITYDANAGNDTVSNMPTSPFVYDLDKEIVLPAHVERDGYTFIGWSEKKDGSGKYFDPGATLGPMNVADHIVLYAIWKPAGGPAFYRITYDANAGTDEVTGMPESPLVYDIDKEIVLPAHVNRGGYTFIGWNYKADGSGKHLDAGAKLGPMGNADHITLYAIWEERSAPLPGQRIVVKYTHDPDYSDGEFERVLLPDGKTYDPDESIVLGNIEKENWPDGYEFIGWKVQGGSETYEAGATVHLDGATILYPMWRRVETVVPNPDPEPEPDPNPNPDPDADPEPEPDPNPDPDPDPEPNPDPEPDPSDEPENPTQPTGPVNSAEPTNSATPAESAAPVVQLPEANDLTPAQASPVLPNVQLPAVTQVTPVTQPAPELPPVEQQTELAAPEPSQLTLGAEPEWPEPPTEELTSSIDTSSGTEEDLPSVNPAFAEPPAAAQQEGPSSQTLAAEGEWQDPEPETYSMRGQELPVPSVSVGMPGSQVMWPSIDEAAASEASAPAAAGAQTNNVSTSGTSIARPQVDGTATNVQRVSTDAVSGPKTVRSADHIPRTDDTSRLNILIMLAIFACATCLLAWYMFSTEDHEEA